MMPSRRDFIRALALALPAAGCSSLPSLLVRSVSVKAGATRPFSLLHASDSHIARIDRRDGEELRAFAEVRAHIGRELGEHYLDEALELARKRRLVMLHTGDFMDYASAANLERAERTVAADDVLAVVGNHEFWSDAEHVETEDRKLPTIARFAATWNGIPASVHELNGVCFFLFDNSFGRVSAETAAAFEDVAARGLPIVMACHVPLWAPGFESNAVCGRPGGERTDATTLAFVERVRRESLVKAVLCGHLHAYREFDFSPTAREYVAGALFAGECTEIAFA